PVAVPVRIADRRFRVLPVVHRHHGRMREAELAAIGFGIGDLARAQRIAQRREPRDAAHIAGEAQDELQPRMLLGAVFLAELIVVFEIVVGGGCHGTHLLPRSSRNRPSFSCTGRSEKLNSTASSSASWICRAQLGITNTSRGPHSSTLSPMRVRPRPSTAVKTVASVER